MIGNYWFVVHFSQHIDCSSTNILVTRRTFSRRPTTRLPTGLGVPKWTSLNRSQGPRPEEFLCEQVWIGLGSPEANKFEQVWGEGKGGPMRPTTSHGDPLVERQTDKTLLSRKLQCADPGFGRGGGQLLRLKVADIAEQSCMSKIVWHGWWKMINCVTGSTLFQSNVEIYILKQI